MTFFGLTITRSKALVTAGAQQLSPVDNGRGVWRSLYRVLESFAGAWQQNVEIRLADVLTYPVVYACMSLISSDIGKMGGARLVALDDDGVWNETTSPAFSPVLRKPNLYQNRIQFYEQWMLSKLGYGNTYVLKQRDDRNVVRQMYVLDPQRVCPLVAPNGDVYYELKRDDLSEQHLENVVVPASEIIHDRMNCFYHPLVGLSPIVAAGLPATMGLKILTNSSKLFANGSQPGGILTYPGDLKQETADRLKAAWTENYSGDNFGAVAVLGNGLEYKPLAMTANDSQLVQQAEWVDRLICMAFGVPAHMVGVGPAPLNNNVAAFKQQYYDQCLMRHVVSIELALDEGMGLANGTFDGVQYGTDMDENTLLRLDPSAMMKSIEDGIKAAVLTPNEGRLMLNRGRVKGGDTPYLQIQNSSIAQIDFRETQEREGGGEINATTGRNEKPQPSTPQVTPPRQIPASTRSYGTALMTKAAELAEEQAALLAA